MPPASPPQFTPTSIEDILYKQGLLRPEQLSAVKLESINTGQPPEKIIRDHNFVSSDQIAQAQATLLGIPFIKLEGKALSAEVVNLIPEPVARRYKLIPVEKQNDKLVVVMADPLDLQVVEFIERKAGLRVQRAFGMSEDIMKAISSAYSQNLTTDVASALRQVSESEGSNGQPQPEKAEVIREAPVANIVTQLLEFAVKANASDIHIEPEETQTRVRYRIDGILYEKIILPKKVHDALISRIKIMANLKIDERRLPQDGRFNFKYSNNDIDLRVSTVPISHGEKVVMRLLAKSTTPPTLQELGLRAVSLKNLETQLLRSHGIIIICGPTGSGKTTTLYSVLTKLSTTKVNILTVEDPIEYEIKGANQVQVNTTIGLTFASALRSFLRQDPNIILVGEIRDTETAELAVQAALTGHQVFSTLHTNSASGSLPRLLDMGIEPFLLASSVNAAVGQRILRKICSHCKAGMAASPEIRENISQVLGPLVTVPNNLMIYKGVGCQFCGHTGYLGRVGVYEVLVVSVKMMTLILKRAPTSEIEKLAVEEGMITLKQDGYLKVVEGMTTLEEVLRVAQD